MKQSTALSIITLKVRHSVWFFLSNRDLQIGRGEPVEDTARVLSRYLDGIMIRTFEQKEVEDLAKYGSIPIINGLTDYCHPCQVLADLMTIREYKKSFDGLKFCFIGDSNNMANSLIVGAITMGGKRQLYMFKQHSWMCKRRRYSLHRRLGFNGSRRRKGRKRKGI